jgi:hypothetical protein
LRKSILLPVVLLFALRTVAQSDTTILFVPCKTGTLIIDGIEKGIIEADDVHREKLSLGEHYIQLKTAAKKYNTTLKLPGLASGIVKLGCEETALGTARIKLLDKKLTLVGIMNQTLEKNTIGLDAGDELIINCHLTNNKGTANLSIKRQETGVEIYKKDVFPVLEDERVRIPQKGIYVVTLSTNALLAREAQLVLERQPASYSDPNFKTTVNWVYDTSFVELQTTNTRVYSTTNVRSPRTVVSVPLPPNTAYWTYWIGVDQAATQQLQDFAKTLSSAGKIISTSPLVQLGFGLIKEIPMFKNMTSTVSYHFADGLNAQLFTAGRPYRPYVFKNADNVSSDYALLRNTPTDISFCFENQSMSMGHDVEVRVVAFIIKRKLAIEK